MFGSRVNNPAWWDPPEDDHTCKSSSTFKGVDFPCDLEEEHPGPHVSSPKQKGHNAVVVWTDPEVL